MAVSIVRFFGILQDQACDELHDYEEQLTTQEEIENFDIEQKRRSRVNYMTKLYTEQET